jgi:adenylate cyclase
MLMDVEETGKFAGSFRDAGEKPLKNIAEAVRVFVSGDGGTVKEPLALPDKPSIAVLPFDNMSGDPEQEYFSDGITEDIITALLKIRWLFVIARNSSFSYKGSSPDVHQVASELGVRYVLEGSVRKGGERIRITAQLIDAATGNHVWAERFDRDPSNIFALQDEITETLIAAIEPELAKAEQQRAIEKSPENLDAWSWFQRGLWHHYKGTKDDNAKAREQICKAIELDPEFSRALAALAHVYILGCSVWIFDHAQ